MKHCPICSSDDIYQSSSIPMRMVGALAMAILVPYGVFLAWIPFVFPRAYICRRCGNETKAEALVHSDWRERQGWLEGEKIKSRELGALENQWIDDGEGPLKKIVYFKENWIAYGLYQGEDRGNIIAGYDEREGKLKLGGEVKFPNVMIASQVKNFLTEEERKNLTGPSEEELKNFLLREGNLHQMATERL